MTLTAVQIRVLGALIEKEIVTPENYPLSLNSLVNACNQRSSRDPVMELVEDEVRQALHGLEDLGLTSTLHDSRVLRFEHNARTVLDLRRDETAVLCLLLLRGAQTPGELRGRSERLYDFDDISAVQATLDRLAARSGNEPGATGPLTMVLPRQPGSREARYTHLFGGTPDVSEPVATATAETTAQRVIRLEAELAALTTTVAELRSRLEGLEVWKQQF
ncbi:MAG: YceH family protein [Acidobacteriaceae bacterium]|nr:YceH family protein [Acidobacteriaceae bacterium]